MSADDSGPPTALTEPVLQPNVGQLMRPPTTTLEPRAHLAGTAYLMKRSGGSALIVTTDDDSRRPIGLTLPVPRPATFALVRPKTRR